MRIILAMVALLSLLFLITVSHIMVYPLVYEMNSALNSTVYTELSEENRQLLNQIYIITGFLSRVLLVIISIVIIAWGFMISQRRDYESGEYY